VVVRENGRAGIDAQCGAHDLPGIVAGAIDGATEEFLAVENAMAVIEPHDVKFFVQQRTHSHAQEVVGIGRAANAARRSSLSFKIPSAAARTSCSVVSLLSR
jgi:hypothetical protein